MENKKNALIIRFSSLGDIVLCSAFVKKWQELNPAGEMTFVTFSHFAPLLSQFPAPLNVMGIDKGGLSHYWRAGWRAGKALTKLPKIYDLQGNLKSFVFVSAAQLSLFLRFKSWAWSHKTPRQTFKRMLSVLLRRNLLGTRFVYLEHQSLLNATSPCTPELKIVVKEVRKNILLAPDSLHWKKRIPEDLCESVIRNILTTTTDGITLVGGAQIVSHDLLDKINLEFPGRIHNLLGQTKLAELASIAASHRLCVCGNSAWLHIAETVDTPVLSFAGPIVKGFGFSPWKNQSIELEVDLKCRPCTRHGGGECPFEGERFHACVKQASWQLPLQKMLALKFGDDL